MAKYYGIKAPEQKIFDNWADCQEYMKGKKGIIQKSFSSKEDCEAFVYDDRAILNPTDEIVNEEVVLKAPIMEDKPYNVNEPVHVHVDGSINKNTQPMTWGAGCVFEQNGVRFKELSFGGPDTTSEWQIVGEVEATLKAIEVAIALGFKEIVIWHDLIHLSAWYLGYYKTDKSNVGRQYVALLEDLANVIKISFVKEKGHTHQPFNERADRLAKNGCRLITL